jgi:hypothetical protein
VAIMGIVSRPIAAAQPRTCRGKLHFGHSGRSTGGTAYEG